MASRSPLLFDDLPTDGPPPAKALKPGQPGKAWREIAPRLWVCDCRNGARIAVGEDGRAFTLKEPRS